MMTTEALTAILGWTAIINVVIFLFSSLTVIVMRGPISRIHARMFGVDEKDLGRAYFQYLGQYKIAIIVLNIAPYFALKLAG